MCLYVWSKDTTIKKVDLSWQALLLSVVQLRQHAVLFIAIITKILGEIIRKFWELPRKLAENLLKY